MRVHEHVTAKAREVSRQGYCVYGRHYAPLENTFLRRVKNGPPRRICKTCDANRRAGA